MRAYLITADSPQPQTFEQVTLPFEQAQHLIGGFITVVPLGHGISALCDEDGLAKGLPCHTRVQHKWGHFLGLCGPLIICGGISDRDGVLPVPESVGHPWLEAQPMALRVLRWRVA